MHAGITVLVQCAKKELFCSHDETQRSPKKQKSKKVGHNQCTLAVPEVAEHQCPPNGDANTKVTSFISTMSSADNDDDGDSEKNVFCFNYV